METHSFRLDHDAGLLLPPKDAGHEIEPFRFPYWNVVPFDNRVGRQELLSGFGDQLLSALAREGTPLPSRVLRLGIDEVPSSGQPAEVLRHHGLDSASLKDRIRQELKG